MKWQWRLAWGPVTLSRGGVLFFGNGQSRRGVSGMVLEHCWFEAAANRQAPVCLFGCVWPAVYSQALCIFGGAKLARSPSL